MTKEQNAVAFFYLLCAAFASDLFFHRWSAFLFIGFLLAFVLKVVNSISIPNHRHEHGSLPLVAAEKGEKYGK